MLRYAQYSPSPPLAPFVEWYWFVEAPGGIAPEPVVPDGRVELIFHYGTPFRRHTGDGVAEAQPTAIVAGQLTAPALLSCPGSAGVAAIRLRPAAVGLVLGERAHLLTDRFERLDNLVALGSVESELADSRTDAERIAALERWLASRAPSRPRTEIAGAVDMLLASGGTAPIANLTRHLPISRRQLERLFPEHVGLSPKTFARIIRMRRAIRLLSRGFELAHVAAACGYCDQPHMVRDFRHLLQGTPKQWQQLDGEFAALFRD
jgi:AraC-like DNA-binding protein